MDQKGNIVNKHIGYNPGDEIKLEEEIVYLLADAIKSDTTLIDSSIIKLLPSDNVKIPHTDDEKIIQKLEVD